MPEIVCPKCRLKQIWRNQEKCIHKGCLWTNWEIATQLGEVICQGHTRPLSVPA